MATFYIDYENVHHSGTAGIEELTNMEYVFLFYSQNANTMNIDTIKRFMNSRCGVEFIEANSGTPNALDFQLITFLFLGIEQDDYHYIISKDRGFDAAIQMGQRYGINNLKRFPTIIEALRHYEKNCQSIENDSAQKEEKKIEEAVSVETSKSENDSIRDEQSATSMMDGEKYRAIIKDKIKRIVQKEANITLPREELEISCEGINVCDNKMKFYHFLRKQLGDKRGRAVYSAINDDFSQLKMDFAV